MIFRILFALTLAVAAAQVAAQVANTDRTMEVRVPPTESSPAPNIQLAHFEYVIPGAAPDSVVDYDQMMTLQKGANFAAKLTLASSQSTFGVRLIFALTPDKPAQLRMQVAQAPPTEAARLTQFHDGANELKDFHCSHGTVYVMFDYRVSPAGHRQKAKK